MSIRITKALERTVREELKRIGSPTHDEAKADGGPSSPTITKVLSGKGTISVASARKFEKLFGWERGELVRVAEGMEPRRKPRANTDNTPGHIENVAGTA